MASVRRRAWSTAAPSGTTISSSTYTPSSYSVGERPLAVEEDSAEGLDQERSMELTQELVKNLRLHIRALVEEFGACADGNFSAPDKWLSDLHVSWLLPPELDASGQKIFISRQLQDLVKSWIPALREISISIWACFSGFYSQEEATVSTPAASEFVRFIEATLCKMLTFVDAIAAPLNTDDPSGQQHATYNTDGPAEKLQALLDMRHALSAASTQISLSFASSPYVHSTRITDDMKGLLSAELGKLDQAICDMVDHIVAAAMSSLEDVSSWDTSHTLQSAPDIHKVTWSVINCIKVLSTKALLSANDAPRHGDMCSLATKITEMVSSLEKTLKKVSQSFPDQCLRFLFLINNFYFIQQQLQTRWPPHEFTHKIDRYIQSYLQVSWEPVLKCLNSPKLYCLTRSSQLQKFGSKFQATYSAQKLWKVPDPGLRERLRGDIIRTVVSSFKEYLVDNNMITPGVTPQEVEEMLQELFEG